MNQPQLRYIQDQRTPSKSNEKANKKNSHKKNLSYLPMNRNHIQKGKEERLKEQLEKLIKHSKAEYKKIGKKNSNILTNYNHSKLLLKEYGTSHMTYIQQLDENQQKEVTKQKGTIATKLRMKIIDSMFHIYTKYSSSPKSLFKCVSIFDNYIGSKNKEFKNESELKLIGMACIFLGSKFEDKIPLGLKHLEMLTENVFTKSEFHRMEKKILCTLNFDIFEADVDDLIRHILIDIIQTNEAKIKELNITKFLPILETLSLYIGKMLLLEPKFIKQQLKIKSIVSIILAFDIMRTHNLLGEADNEKGKFLDLILRNYLSLHNIDKHKAECFYTQISDFYQSNLLIDSSYIGDSLNDYIEQITK